MKRRICLNMRIISCIWAVSKERIPFQVRNICKLHPGPWPVSLSTLKTRNSLQYVTNQRSIIK